MELLNKTDNAFVKNINEETIKFLNDNKEEGKCVFIYIYINENNINKKITDIYEKYKQYNDVLFYEISENENKYEKDFYFLYEILKKRKDFIYVLYVLHNKDKEKIVSILKSFNFLYMFINNVVVFVS